MPRKILGKKTAQKSKNIHIKYVIDCTQPVEDKVLTTKDFEEFLKNKIKIHGQTGKLGHDVSISNDAKRVILEATIPFSKRYLKYLSKKYLKKHQLRDYLHVISADKNTYQLKYFNIQQDELDNE